MTKIILFDLSDIYTVIADLSALNVIETIDQIGDCCLSCTGGTHKCHIFSRLNIKCQV